MKTIDQLLEEYNFAVILSANNKNLNDLQNAHNNAGLLTCLRSTNEVFLHVEGKYDGVSEPAVIVFANNFHDVAEFRILGINLFKQECVLVLDLRNGCASLEFKDDSSQIGTRLIEVTEHDLEDVDAYSIIDNRYFVVG